MTTDLHHRPMILHTNNTEGAAAEADRESFCWGFCFCGSGSICCHVVFLRWYKWRDDGTFTKTQCFLYYNTRCSTQDFVHRPKTGWTTSASTPAPPRVTLEFVLVFFMSLFSCCFPRLQGEVSQEILCGRCLQLHLPAAQPGRRHAVRRGQGGAVRPQPLRHQQDQAAEERKDKKKKKVKIVVGFWWELQFNCNNMI